MNAFTVFVSHLPSWRSPGWNRNSLCPVQPAASRPSQPCSEPNAEGRWTWRVSPTLQVLCAEHVHPSKQQFPKIMKTVTFKYNGIKKCGSVDSLSNGRNRNGRLYDVSQRLTKQNVSISTHEGLSINMLVLIDRLQACAAETSHDREYRCTIKVRRKKALGKTSLSCLPFLPHQVSGACVRNTNPPVVIVQQQRDIQSMPSQCWEQTQNGDGMISASSPYKTHICTLANFNWFH